MSALNVPRILKALEAVSPVGVLGHEHQFLADFWFSKVLSRGLAHHNTSVHLRGPSRRPWAVFVCRKRRGPALFFRVNAHDGDAFGFPGVGGHPRPTWMRKAPPPRPAAGPCPAGLPRHPESLIRFLHGRVFPEGRVLDLDSGLSAWFSALSRVDAIIPRERGTECQHAPGTDNHGNQDDAGSFGVAPRHCARPYENA